MKNFLSCLALPFLAVVAPACTDAGPDTLGESVDNVQVPPRGAVDVQTWLARDYYKSWHCEPEKHASRAPSPHGTNRICNNDAIHDATGDLFPEGAASVKELYNGKGEISAFAVYRKIAAGEGSPNWYWYEGSDGDTAANGTEVGVCVDCHSHAERDFVFTIVR